MGMLINPYFRGQPLTLNDMWPTVEVKDITDIVDSRLFLPIPSDHHEFKKIGVVADPGAGKTQLAIHLAKRAFDAYGVSKINILYGRDVSQLLPKMDAKPVQFLIVDDASGAQNSRKAYENIDTIQDVLTARHTARIARERVTDGPSGGIVFLMFIWQYYMTLEKNFRKFHYAFLKTYEINERNPDYKQLLGGYGDVLRRNTLKIEAGDQNAKCYSLCAIPSMFQEGNQYAGRGVYRSSLVTDFPQFPDTNLVHEQIKTHPVDDLFKDIDREKLFKAREISLFLKKGMTQAEAGEPWGMSQPDVSKLLKWYHSLGGVRDSED